jgi:sulfate permease, SulP family
MQSILLQVTIMFPSKRFAANLGSLARFAFLSSAIHQVTMSFFSKLPFAIGQVQDVGLIFLSAMSTSVATLVFAEPGAGDAAVEKADRVMMTTTLMAMTLATCMTGVLLMLVGWCASICVHACETPFMMHLCYRIVTACMQS